MEQKYCNYCMSPINGDVCPVCSKAQTDYKPSPHHLRVGTVLSGKYLVGSVLGEGGFGITYIGKDINLDMKIAIKEYYPAGLVNRNNDSSNEITANIGNTKDQFEKGKKSFLSEARTLAKFSDELSIVSVRDFFSENNTAYIVMEYLQGTDLKDYIAKNGTFAFDQCITMLSPIMKALSKIHSTGLIHRDISPANIMILNSGAIKLLDFGAAREVSNDEKSLSILLKPGYAPEEQYRTKGNQGPWTDVYALCATMYKMMTGVTPDDAMNRLFSDETKGIDTLNHKVTKEQSDIILKGMAIHQENRYQSIDELYTACTNYNVATTTPPALDDEITYRGDSENIPVINIPTADEKTIGKQDVFVQAEPEKNVENKIEKQVIQSKKTKTPQPNKKEKKPNIFCFITSVITGLMTMLCIMIFASDLADEFLEFKDRVFPAIGIIVFGVATFFLSRFYFPRLDNKNRKPNVVCMILSFVSIIFVIVCAYAAYATADDWASTQSEIVFSTTLAILSLVFPIFFGYFYYPRLDRKKKKFYTRLYTSVGVSAIAILLIIIIFTSLNTVTIGDENIRRNETTINLHADIINNNDLAKLKELKKLESLTIDGCFMDNEDVKTIGELTQLKELSLILNTDITDVSPLNNLTNLETLNIHETKVTDISCLDKLTKLTRLDISSTKIKDLSILETYTVLTNLEMKNIEGLDPNTIALPASLETLYCGSNNLNSLDFVKSSDALHSIYAENNNISDLSPLSKFELYIASLPNNKISDLSPLNFSSSADLDVSTNQISDISPLKEIKLSKVDLAYNNISDISALKDNYYIISLDISNNNISDISALKDCFKIYSLDISYNQIEDLSAIETIDELGIFTARSNKIKDISPLAKCKIVIEEGTLLDLRDNQIENIDALKEYKNTTAIYLSNNNITDISALSNCTALEQLLLNNNNVSDISSIYGLPSLKTLQIAGNLVDDLSGLSLAYTDDTIIGKSSLFVSYNENINFEPLINNEHLNLFIYDTPPRVQNQFRKDYNFYNTYSDLGTLDEVEENQDLVEENEEETEENTEDSDG